MPERKNQKQNINFQDLWEIKQKLISRKDFIAFKLNKKLKELKEFDIKKIAEMFTYENMQASNKDFCALYKANNTCHEVNHQDLNCYGCYCPNYKAEICFDKDLELYKAGICSIKSKFGFYKKTQTKDEHKKDFLILNCVNCLVPHKKNFVQKIIEKDLANLK